MHTKPPSLLALLLPLALTAQTIDGSWKGTLKAGPQSLTLVLHIDKPAQSVTMDVVEQGVEGLPMEAGTLLDDTLRVAVPQLGLSYEGRMAGDSLIGTFRQQSFEAPLSFVRGQASANRPQEPHAPYPYSTVEVSFRNDSAHATLAGTLTYPVGYRLGAPVPVVLMVTGSGPQNRDDEVFRHRPFLVIADHLARHGIATLRYDDRGVGRSTGIYAAATTDDLAADAACGLQYLRGMRLFSKVGVLGHSEGGMIAYMLGSEGKADFIVSLAGPACRIDTMMVLQLNGLARVQGQGEPVAKTTADARRIMLAADGGEWMKRFIDTDMRPCVSRVQCPVLALAGEKDLNVPPTLNTPALEEALPHNAKTVVKTYPGLNHFFQHCQTGNPTEAGGIEETISPQVLEDIAQWIKGL